jgi:hypothetical protein
MAGPGDHSHFATGYVLAYKFGFVAARENVFVTCDQQRRNIDGLQCIHRVWAFGHTTLHLSDVFGGHFSHHLQRSFHQIGARLASCLTHQPRGHTFEERFRAALDNVVGGLQATCVSFGVIGGRFGIAEAQSGNAAAMTPPELEERISADGNTDYRGSADFGIVHNASYISGVLGHGGGTLADARLAVAAKVEKDGSVARGKNIRDRQPEFMIYRKGMKKNYGMSVTQNAVGNLRVSAFYGLHGTILRAA